MYHFWYLLNKRIIIIVNFVAYTIYNVYIKYYILTNKGMLLVIHLGPLQIQWSQSGYK